MMNRLLLTTALVSFLGSVGSASWLLFSDPEATDLVALPAPVQYLGEIERGTTKYANFRLHNQSAEPIKIMYISTSCTCTTSLIDKLDLASGQACNLTLAMNTKAMQGEVTVQAIVVYRAANSGTLRSIVVAGQGDVTTKYTVSPKRMVFGDEFPLVQRAVITDPHSKLLLTGVAVNRSYLAAVLLPETNDNQGERTIEVSFIPTNYHHDSNSAEVTFQIDCKDTPTVVLPVDIKD